MALPKFTLSELLEAGVHFGHQKHRWNPQMKHYIYGVRNGVHIIDLQQTVPMLYQALGFIRNTVAGGGRVLFVGTKRQAQKIISEQAERSGQYYVNHRWLGGALTNWKTISKSINRLKELEEMFAGAAAEEEARADREKRVVGGEDLPEIPLSAYAQRTKKEKLMMQREHDKLNLVLGGIKNMGGLPDAVIVLDVIRDRIAVDEANCLGIPVIGILDTNATPAGVNFPIPGNDDSARAISLYCRLFSDAVLSGIEAQAQTSAGDVSIKQMAKGKPSKREANVTLSPKAEKAAEQAEVEAKAKSAEKAAEKATEAAKATKKLEDKVLAAS